MDQNHLDCYLHGDSGLRVRSQCLDFSPWLDLALGVLARMNSLRVENEVIASILVDL